MKRAHQDMSAPPDHDRCTAMTMHKGRCRWPRAKGATETTLCGHHLTDLQRGCASAHKEWKSAGLQELDGAAGQAIESLDILKPMIALRVQAAHVSRVVAHMEQEPFSCSLSFAEKTRKGKAVLTLFSPPCDADLQCIIEKVVANSYMLRILAGLPAVVQHSSTQWHEAYNFCSLDQQNEPFKKFVTDPIVRDRLKDVGDELSTSRNKITGKVNESDTFPAITSSNSGDVELGSLMCILSVYEGARYVFGNLRLPFPVISSLLMMYKQVSDDRSTKRVCKAVQKIEEIFGIREWNKKFDTNPRVALDIGASPGSWSAWLLEYMKRVSDEKRVRVVAVDPGNLAPDVLSMDGIQHVRVFASKEDISSFHQISQAVLDGNTELNSSNKRKGADIVVCDMNRHPLETASLLQDLGYAGLLANRALVVITLKMAVMSSVARSSLENEALSTLGECFIDKQVHHLFGNTRYESTVSAIYRSTSDPGSKESKENPIM